ncbi:MAG: hypothetical protein AAB066_05140 [Candidatus Margulisiibacteriota bacterium]
MGFKKLKPGSVAVVAMGLSGVDRYIGETRFNLVITTSGVLAGAHLVGFI